VVTLPKEQKTGNETTLDSLFVCRTCGNKELYEDLERGESICRNCGTVVSDKKIDHGPEWRAFTADEHSSRARTSVMPSYGSSTRIDQRDRDAAGRPLKGETRSSIYRLRKWQIRTAVHSSKDRNLAQATGEMETLASQLHTPKPVKDLWEYLYKKALRKRISRGRSIKHIAVATLYAAYRKRQKFMTLEKIAKASDLDKKSVGMYYRLLVYGLNLRMPLQDPADYVSFLGSELDLTQSVQTQATEILKQAKERGITMGKDPTGLAAASIYIASVMWDERRTQQQI
jgi:transcription initiation factor TFIIB